MPVKIPGSKVIFGASKRVKNEEKRPKKIENFKLIYIKKKLVFDSDT